MARPFRQPENEGEEAVSVEGAPQQGARRPREVPQEEPDEYDSPDEDTGQHYERLLLCIYNVISIVLRPPHHHNRRRNPERVSGRRQQVAGEWEPTAAELRGAVPRRRSRVSTALAAEAARAHEESDVEGDGLWEMAAEARRMIGRRRLSSRTVATETEEEPPRGASGNCQLASSAAEPAGARRSMSTSSTQCSYEDWAEEGSPATGEGEEEVEEEDEDEVFVASRPGDAHPPPRPPSPPPPSSNFSGPGDSRSSGGGSLQSRKQRRKRSGGGSSGGGGRTSQRQSLFAAAPVEDDPKMAAARMAMEEWDAVSRELRNLRWKGASHFKQSEHKALKARRSSLDRGGTLTALLSPLLPSAMPGVWTLVAVCVGARVIGRLW